MYYHEKLSKLKLVWIVLPILLFFTNCKENVAPDPIVPEVKPAKVYVACEFAGEITVIDAHSYKILKSINLSTHNLMIMPHNVQAAPDGKTIWVTGMSMEMNYKDQLIIIDPVKDIIIKRIDLGYNIHPAHVVIDEKSENAYFTANYTDDIIEVNIKTLTLSDTFHLKKGALPHGIRYYNNRLYIANSGTRDMAIIDVFSKQVSYIPLGGEAIQTGVTPNGKYAFVSLYDKKQVARYDLSNGNLRFLDLPADSKGPVQIYPTPDSKMLLVCDQGDVIWNPSNKVYIIDITNCTVSNTITAGLGTHGVVVSADGKFAYVTNKNFSTVSIIDMSKKEVIATIPVDSGPNGISYWYETGGMP